MVPARKSGYAVPALNVQNLESPQSMAETVLVEEDVILTYPDTAKDVVAKTGVDALAIAIGILQRP